MPARTDVRIDVVTIFSEYLAPLDLSLVGKAREAGLLELNVHDLRTWAVDRPGSYMAELTRRLCRESGFEPRVVCRFNNYLLLLRHVSGGEKEGQAAAVAAAAARLYHKP